RDGGRNLWRRRWQVVVVVGGRVGDRLDVHEGVRAGQRTVDRVGHLVGEVVAALHRPVVGYQEVHVDELLTTGSAASQRVEVDRFASADLVQRLFDRVHLVGGDRGVEQPGPRPTEQAVAGVEDVRSHRHGDDGVEDVPV